MRAADEFPPRARVGWVTRVVELIELAFAKAAQIRGVMQFAIATVLRVERHRLTLAVAAGATIALLLPVLLGVVRNPDGALAVPPGALLSAPFTVVLFSVVGLRVAAALPGDIHASWVFASAGVEPEIGRRGLRRIMILFGLLPATVVAGSFLWLKWGLAWGLTHAAMCLAVGLLLVEIVLRKYGGVPCSGAWRPEGANLRSRWPGYLAGFVLFTQALPRLSYVLVGEPVALMTVVAVLLAAAVILKLRRVPESDEPDAEGGAPAVLNLSS
jgi:hypothetical protein